MTVHLTLETRFQDTFREITEQATRTRQFHSLGFGSIYQLLRELLVNHR